MMHNKEQKMSKHACFRRIASSILKKEHVHTLASIAADD